MKRLRWGALSCVGSILALALTGCDFVGWVNVIIPDFYSKQVQGVWVWRSPQATGPFAHYLQVPVPNVLSPTSDTPISGVFQNVTDSGGNQQVVIVRAQADSANPDGIMLKIGVGTIPDYVKVSTYNADGESALSEAEATL